ncbi:hypothetical protein Rai3103_05140 [Raineyella fluvialis]|uniref:Phosphoenolpyruvate synthase n=1 Tax=Raineyella fluvialis TaxID=2662261 RepID=A0A5Q2F8J6_9ACTN|nr:PEP/pyruvate-binding domain-containing protein [Raineyella fluvialis]QGF23149.1 hypothetical protein Rai3103_05140 [Raineyella fluvialis]
MAAFTVPLDDADATLAIVGGKGLNLIRLTRAGFDVPGGLVITTAAYTAHVTAHALGPLIERALEGLDPADAPALEEASARIRAAFAAGAIPQAVREAILAAAGGLTAVPLAVRSSATAEDLPDLSFAGQQETYLNVLGAEQLLRAVVDCWSSLWTARAIGYRLRSAIPSEDVSLAVVVQELVAARASGVMFTADPLTGLRDRTVIDAVAGLGEALVSGQVEPDHWVADADGRILERALGAKAVTTVPTPGGGVETVPAVTVPTSTAPAAGGRPATPPSPTSRSPLWWRSAGGSRPSTGLRRTSSGRSATRGSRWCRPAPSRPSIRCPRCVTGTPCGSRWAPSRACCARSPRSAGRL